MKVLYTNTNYILSSLFKKWVQPIVGRFMDSSLNFAQKVSKNNLGHHYLIFRLILLFSWS